MGWFLKKKIEGGEGWERNNYPRFVSNVYTYHLILLY